VSKIFEGNMDAFFFVFQKIQTDNILPYSKSSTNPEALEGKEGGVFLTNS